MSSSSGVLRHRLNDLRDDHAQRAEHVLGGARVVLSISALTAFAARPIASGQGVRFASALLLAYVLYAVCLGLAVWLRAGFAGYPLSWTLHVLDAAWIAAITLVTGGADSPFFILAGFALFSAAYRWGLRETIGTAVLLIALLLAALVLLASRTRVESLTGMPVILRAVYVLVGATLIGYLAESGREARDTASSVARIARQLRPEEGARHALDGALRELLSVFDAKTVLLVARDQSNGRLYRWNATSTDADSDVTEVDLEPSDERTYLFPAPAETWSAVHHDDARGRRVEVIGLHAGETRPRTAEVVFPDQFLVAHPFRSLLVASASDADRWAHRLLLIDARAGARELRSLRMIAQQVGPAIYSVELLARLRSRIGAAERARVARDLHDGIIQSLIGLEMTVDVWRRQAAADSPAASQLGHIQNALRTEVLELRDLIVRMKTVSVDPKHVLEHLAALVERFQRDSGIAAHFVAEIDELDLAPHVCDEIVRIVQEALVNVRRHSGARHVLVRVSAAQGHWTFEVDDDGHGFEFAGRRSQVELDVERKGPVIIKERVRAIGGQLAVESDPGHGARVEVQLSQRTHG